MDKHKTFGICNEHSYLVKSSHEVMSLGEDTTELLNTVYKEISEELGMDTALAIYKMFKGMQICFPVKFFNPECIKKVIIAEYNGKNIKQLGKKYGYSEKTIRRIIKNSL